MCNAAEHAFKEKSAKLLILLSLRTIYFRTFQSETPCIIFPPNEIIFEHCGLPMQRSRELLLLKRSEVETRNRLVFIHNIEKQISLTQIKF